MTSPDGKIRIPINEDAEAEQPLVESGPFVQATTMDIIIMRQMIDIPETDTGPFLIPFAEPFKIDVVN
jgi:hypothetical protein